MARRSNLPKIYKPPLTLSEIEAAANASRKDFGAGSSLVANVLNMLGDVETKLGGHVKFLRAHKRFRHVKAWTNGDTRTIYFSERVERALQMGRDWARETGGHEIGHFILRHPGLQYKPLARKFAANRNYEFEADCFVGFLLVPTESASHCKDAREIREVFQVPQQLAQMRWTQLNSAKQADPIVLPAKIAKRVQSIRRVFVAMPFDAEQTRIYKSVIRPAVEKLGYACARADELRTPNVIISDIKTSIAECDVVIGDITGHNANVMMEIGYADAIGKPIVLIGKQGTPLPFNIAHIRTHFFEDTFQGREALRLGLHTLVHTAATSRAR